MHFLKFSWILFFIIISLSNSFAQIEKGAKVELISGSSKLEGKLLDEEKIRIVLRDSIRQLYFKQDFTRMFCDSAVQFLERNDITAFGRIQLIDRDSTVLRGDTLYYDGDRKFAKMRGNVIMIDKDKTVTTQKLDYNMRTHIAYYFDGGTVRDTAGTVLISKKGYYNTKTKIVNFKQDVVYKSPDTHLMSDSLTYDTRKSVVHFDAPTKITTRDGFLEAAGGQYNTVLGTSIFEGRSKIETSEYIIVGDTVDYDKVLEKGIAQGNVDFYLKKDRITIRGDYGKHDGVVGKSEVFGHGLMIKPDESGADTLFLAADTLIAFTDTTQQRELVAYSRVKLYRRDFQASCDSMRYDSLIRFYKNPILWADKSQMVAESMDMAVDENNRLDSLNLKAKAFIISQDTLLNFNQIKGRQVSAKFKENNLERIWVRGNGESVFHVLQSDTLLTGLNRIQCADMIMSFSEEQKNKLKEVLFINQPEGKFIPPQHLSKAHRFLDNFAWRIDEKPEKNTVLGIYSTEHFPLKDWQHSEVIADVGFRVLLKNRRLLFYKNPCKPLNIKDKFILRVYPKNIKDLPIERRSAGFVELDFEFPSENLKDGTATHIVDLPDFKIKKIITGRQRFLNGTPQEELSIYEF